MDAKGNVLLSKREQDVVRLVVEGLSNREIADQLSLSQHTVKNTLFRIFDKLGVANRVELILHALNQLEAIPRAASRNGNPNTLAAHMAVPEVHDIADCCSVPLTVAEQYREGKNVARDDISAYMWFVIAETLATTVCEKSTKACASLSARMRAEEVSEAKRRADDWLKLRRAAETKTSRGMVACPGSPRQ